jgi:hypothetical protein
MFTTANRKLKVFLCHAKEDKPIVRELYRQLIAEKWLDVWLDELNLLPGQNWDVEIKRAAKQSDVVIVCLSNKSIQKEGYIQKEMRYVLDVAEEKPEDTIFVIPVRLDDCSVPERIQSWHWIDFFPKNNQGWAYHQLTKSLKLRAAKLEIATGISIPVGDKEEDKSKSNADHVSNSSEPLKAEYSTQVAVEDLKEIKRQETNRKAELIDSVLLGGIIFLVVIAIALGRFYFFYNPFTTITPDMQTEIPISLTSIPTLQTENPIPLTKTPALQTETPIPLTDTPEPPTETPIPL